MFHIIDNIKRHIINMLILNDKIVSKIVHTPPSPNQLGLCYNTSNNHRFRVFTVKNVPESI